MPFRAKVLVREPDRNAQAQNRQVTAHAHDSLNVPMNDGRTRSNIVVPAGGSVVVAHTLGRMPKGYSITNGNNNAITDSDRSAGSITLHNSGTTAATLTLWIY
jgi:hypothetical protein